MSGFTAGVWGAFTGPSRMCCAPRCPRGLLVPLWGVTTCTCGEVPQWMLAPAKWHQPVTRSNLQSGEAHVTSCAGGALC